MPFTGFFFGFKTDKLIKILRQQMEQEQKMIPPSSNLLVLMQVRHPVPDRVK